MTTQTYAGADVTVDAEGFLTDPSAWTVPIAEDIARREGVEELTPRHWHVISLMRKEFREKGTAPNVRALAKTSGVSIKELYQLFPKGPAKVAAKIAGVPKPRGCI
jgi:tRNA 2-thiouridine synthesizing protein E